MNASSTNETLKQVETLTIFQVSEERFKCKSVHNNNIVPDLSNHE